MPEVGDLVLAAVHDERRRLDRAERLAIVEAVFADECRRESRQQLTDSVFDDPDDRLDR